MKKYILMIISGLVMTSCVDTVILPNSKTVDEDYWQTKSEVSAVVAQAYKTLISTTAMEDMIVWGGFRSDEQVPNTTLGSGYATIRDDLNEIYNANIQTDNTFNNWGTFYSCINYCNIVLEKAEGVQSLDPDYTDGDYQADRAQMLALRALCYFYLVRTFRDVPYSREAFMNSSMDLNLPQVNPDSILQASLVDLKEARGNAISSSAYADWRRVGYITRDAIDAIIADIYLWLASVENNNSYYQECINYCDNVIESKKSQHTKGRNETDADEFPLAEGDRMFTELYGDEQNAEESIFELQVDGSSNSNTGLENMYAAVASSVSSPYVYASRIFDATGSNDYDDASAVYLKTNDTRYWNACFGVNSSSESFNIKKYVGSMASNSSSSSYSFPTYANYGKNFIIYRLTDVMLMKAEAIVALQRSLEKSDSTWASSEGEQEQLYQAFHLFNAVNKRAVISTAKTDSFVWNTFASRSADEFEKIILAERFRELCFEGKRWFDLMRYNYREMHRTGVTPIPYTMTMAAYKEANGESYPRNTDAFFSLMLRKYTQGGSSVQAKWRTEPFLYMPIPRSDTKVNPNLNQNPVYSDSDEYEKNV